MSLNNLNGTYEFKQKIAKIYKEDSRIWNRVSDYIWNTKFIIDNCDICIDRKKISLEDLNKMKDDFSIVVEKILNLDTQEIIFLLKNNKPSEDWTMANIESVKLAFIK